MTDITTRLRALEADHEPDGWPAVQMRDITALLAEVEALRKRAEAAERGIPKERIALNVRHRDCHKAADAFWDYWKENGETHKHGYYESTWGAINRALRVVGVVEHEYMKAAADVIAALKEPKP